MKSTAMPDVQSSQDTRQEPIHRVGIRGVTHPFAVSVNQELVHTVGDWTLTVYLPASEKGTHMSRFVQLLDSELPEEGISPEAFVALAQHMRTLLESDEAQLKVKFPFFMFKYAPISNTRSRMNYEVTWEAVVREGKAEFKVTALVPVMSLCPCSKIISKYGAHNQRSHIVVTATLDPAELDLHGLIRMIEKQGACELWALLKRPDEKYVTERSYENPKFVEDLIRDVVLQLRQMPEIKAFEVEAENFESIHNHSAYAYISSELD